MGQIIVKFDNQLKQSEIIMPLIHSSKDESGKDYKYNIPARQQTQVHGILSPIIMINNIVIDFDAVIEFSLKSNGPLPTLTMMVFDRFNLISTLKTPGMDNEVRIQILPPFDGVYKKIDMTFYISNIKVMNGKHINITALYKSQTINNTQFKSFGKISTYDLFSNIAKESKLGFASNVNSSQDERYVYCDNKNYIELMSKEISHSGSETLVYDWWIDFWNNINFVDIHERYNSVDEGLKLWVSGQIGEVTEGSKIHPNQVDAIISNHPSMSNNELFVKDYGIKNKTGSSVNQGTDHLYSIYSNNLGEHMDYLIQDGDVKKDVFCKYEYLGEVYGDYDYLLAEKKRSSFLQKINSESIEVVMKTPLLGLMRGHKVNFNWYINDSLLSNKKDNLNKAGVINDDTLNQDENAAGEFKLDTATSGQYLITMNNIRYSNQNGWEHILTLNRPASMKTNVLKDE